MLDPFILVRVKELRRRAGLRTAKEERELSQLINHRIFMPVPKTLLGRLKERLKVWKYGHTPTELLGATTDDRGPSERAGGA